MAVRLVEGRKISPENSGESLPGYVARNAIRTSLAPIQALAGAPGELESVAQHAIGPHTGALLGVPQSLIPNVPKGQTILPTTERVRKTHGKIAEKLGAPKGYLEPQGFGENVLNAVASDLPLMLAFGGGSLPRQLATSAASNVARQGAQEAGFGPIGQSAAGIASGIGFDFLRRGGSLKNVKKLADKERHLEYEKAKPWAEGTNVQASEVEKSLTSSIKDLDTLKTKDTAEARKLLNQAKNSIHDGSLNVKRAWDLKKKFNELGYAHDTNSTVSPFYKKTAGVLNEFLDKASEISPEFGVPYQRAEDLTIGLKSQSALREILEDNTSFKKILSNPGAKLGILGTAYFGGGKGLAAATLPASIGARNVLRYYDFYRNSDEARKLVAQIGKDAINHNKTALANNLRKLNSLADEYDEQHPMQEEGNVKLISGRKIA